MFDLYADAGDAFDGPASFTEAAEYMADLLANVTQTRAAEVLSRLAKAGLIVSPALHDELAQGYAAQLSHAHAAADDLLHRLDGSME